MSEATPARDESESTSAPAADTYRSAGQLLQEGRVATGLHIAALAVALKVPVHKLEALEADRFDLLPDAVFVRGLAASVCRALKMDAAPVLALLPTAVPRSLSHGTARTSQVYASGGFAHSPSVWRALPFPVMASAAVLVAATLGLVAWPYIQGALNGYAVPSVASETWVPTEVITPASEPSAALMTPESQAQGAVLTTAVPLVMAQPEVPAAPPVPAPLAIAAPTSSPVSGVAPSTVPAPVVSGTITFNPASKSWVEVTDAKGAVLLRRMLAPGEMVGASGALPLSVVVGRADVTKVQVRGQAFDLSSIARENVARFEVK